MKRYECRHEDEDELMSEWEHGEYLRASEVRDRLLAMADKAKREAQEIHIKMTEHFDITSHVTFTQEQFNTMSAVQAELSRKEGELRALAKEIE